MPVHLYTIPAGNDLPDPSTVPDGYPYLLNSVSGKRILLTNNGGAWQEVIPPGVNIASATFVAVIPAKPVADSNSQTIPAGVGGIPGVGFYVPYAIAGAMPNSAVLSEIYLQTTGTTNPPDVVSVQLLTNATTSDQQPFPPTEGLTVFFGPDNSNISMRFLGYQTDDSPLWTGVLMTANVLVGPDYSAAEDVTIVITVIVSPPE